MKLPAEMRDAGLPPVWPLADIGLLEDWLIERNWYLWVFHEDHCPVCADDEKAWFVARIGHWRCQLFFQPMPARTHKDINEWSIGVGDTKPTMEECRPYYHRPSVCIDCA